MTADTSDFIDDDAPPAVKRRRPREESRLTDRILGGSIVALAAFATFFPWYAFFHQDKFSIPTLWEGNTRDLPETDPRKVISVSPLAMTDSDQQAREQPEADPLITATVPSLGKEKSDGKTPSGGFDQPFPGSKGFKLMHVANGRALIEDSSGMYIVRIGSILPDNSRLATIEQREGKWVIVTSNGAIYQGK